MESAGEFDYIIIGGGTAGCVLANRLTRDKNATVLLVEAGGKDDYVWIHIPVGYLHCIGNPRTDWLYSTEADAGLGGRSLIYPRGKVLGGSSSINGMIYMRGQAQDYDRWAELTRRRFLGLGPGAAAVQAKRGLSWRRVAPPWRRRRMAGGKTALVVGYPERFPRCGGAGRHRRKRRTSIGGDNSGSSYFDVNQRRGIRWNTSKAFLKPASRRPNLTIMTGCHVERLQITAPPISGPRCTGIMFTGGGTQWQATRPPRNGADGRRHRLTPSAAIVRHRTGRLAAPAWHCPAWSTPLAWAAICRIICSCAWYSRCRA